VTAGSVAASSLDPNTLMLVRIAALVAVDAPPVSYLLNLDAAGEIGLDAERVRGVLAAVAPIVGTARVASATGKIVEALAIDIEIAEIAEQKPGVARHRWGKPGGRRARAAARRFQPYPGRAARADVASAHPLAMHFPSTR
jgi:4-carboxymuconolactone decarboxylase